MTISIYASPVTVRPEAKPAATNSSQPAGVLDSKTSESFQVVHYEGNRRIFQRRNTLEKAKALMGQRENKMEGKEEIMNLLREMDAKIESLKRDKEAK